MPGPLIALSTATTHNDTALGSRQRVTLLNNTLIELVASLGCTPVLLPNAIEPSSVSSWMGKFDGLILTSGQDVDPASYGAKCEVEYTAKARGFGTPYERPLSLAPDAKRDKVELALYQAAKERRLPILGVCRGMQLINVAEGGTLHQEIPPASSVRHELDEDGWINYHSLILQPDTLSAEILGRNAYFISSIHHQAVNVLGRGLRASATAEDGIVEMIEHTDPNLFILGVQGHVEKSLQNLKSLEGVWQAFARRARSTPG
ncbi:gamma-glutamyl-gamma-aminobutyrate hydrolase family protein [Stigmatella aurantiaca]|uniref:Glutamine amidotransferase n=1 Tax=Stigmatella aurantiaca (strain DW4/3-1) TaxID=378806 RepID=Q095N6_STIAD|nr:gamma-glutamyl-gamma-aminobutyrate hydrolase family protein [Stigmatella aurantiaca]ADO68343.1 Peptidase C26 family protein, predicted glutamine amidotransferase [Stigmatella aurantiaca DW4/3-1]EAU67463.1 glutamine amidotransferase [Stigmatella aurantiaca DW4/3-1]